MPDKSASGTPSTEAATAPPAAPVAPVDADPLGFSGTDDSDVYGGLVGGEVGEMKGGWGLKVALDGGVGGVGSGYGTGSGNGTGSRRGEMRGSEGNVPRVVGTRVTVGDGDKDVIRRYVRRALPSVRSCYEKQLLVNPKLAGTVVVDFTINEDGSVANAEGTGMNKDVANCVAAAIRAVLFPKPRRVGFVKVHYPFKFLPDDGKEK